MSKLTEFQCPYINRKKAEIAGTMYYCDFDNMEFEEITAHCFNCEMYEYLLKKLERYLFGGL